MLNFRWRDDDDYDDDKNIVAKDYILYFEGHFTC
jgi:hypothetical protein